VPTSTPPIGTWPGAGALLALALGCAVLVAVLIGLVAS